MGDAMPALSLLIVSDPRVADHPLGAAISPPDQWLRVIRAAIGGSMLISLPGERQIGV